MDFPKEITMATISGVVMLATLAMGIAATVLRNKGYEPVRSAARWVTAALIFTFLGSLFYFTPVVLSYTDASMNFHRATVLLVQLALLAYRLSWIQIFVGTFELGRSLLLGLCNRRTRTAARWVVFIAAAIEAVLAAVYFILCVVQRFDRNGLLSSRGAISAIEYLYATFDVVLMVACVGVLGYCAHVVGVTRKRSVGGMAPILLATSALLALLHKIALIVYDFKILLAPPPKYYYGSSYIEDLMIADFVMDVLDYVLVVAALALLFALIVRRGGSRGRGVGPSKTVPNDEEFEAEQQQKEEQRRRGNHYYSPVPQ